MHVRYLLRELGVDGDLPLLATAILAPLELVVLEQQVAQRADPGRAPVRGLGRPGAPGVGACTRLRSLLRPRARRHVRRLSTVGAVGRQCPGTVRPPVLRRSPNVSPSTSAPHDASITLAPTPTVTHDDSPSVVSISTRVMASVPWPWSRMRTL